MRLKTRLRQTASLHAHARKSRHGRRRRGILWDYNLDGQSPFERIKDSTKRYWTRWTRRHHPSRTDVQ